LILFNFLLYFMLKEDSALFIEAHTIYQHNISTLMKTEVQLNLKLNHLFREVKSSLFNLAKVK